MPMQQLPSVMDSGGDGAVEFQGNINPERLNEIEKYLQA